MSNKKKPKKKQSVIPFYMVGGFWIMWSIIGALAHPGQFFSCLFCSLLVLFVGKAIWPAKVVVEPEKKVEEPVKQQQPIRPVTTGDPELDRMIADKNKAIAEMLRLDEAIEDEVISNQIRHMEVVTVKIVNYVVEHPEKKKQVKRFFNYYLPTTIKLLNAYDRMDEAGVSGVNIDGTMGRIEVLMDTALSAFDKQLDALYADEAMDISTDITVMENLMKSEGLTDNPMVEEAMANASAFNADSMTTIDDILKDRTTEKEKVFER